MIELLRSRGVWNRSVYWVMIKTSQKNKGSGPGRISPVFRSKAGYQLETVSWLRVKSPHRLRRRQTRLTVALHRCRTAGWGAKRGGLGGEDHLLGKQSVAYRLAGWTVKQRDTWARGWSWWDLSHGFSMHCVLVPCFAFYCFFSIFWP